MSHTPLPISMIRMQSDATSPRLKIVQGEVCDYDMEEDDDAPPSVRDITPKFASTIHALQNRPLPKKK